MTLTIIVIAFICGFVLDVIWAMCVIAITAKRPCIAAHLSVVLYFCTVVSTILIVERCVWAIAAYTVGCWLGTYLVVRWQSKRTVPCTN